MTFIKRKIELTFGLGKGDFGLAGEDVLIVNSARVECNITQTVGPSLGQAHVRVYGLSESLLNQLSALNNVQMAARMNRLLIKAGDEKSGMATVFNGQIQLCQIDMASAPDVALNIHAYGALLEKLRTLEPRSYPGSADAAVILQNLANDAGYLFENSGVSVMLETPYYPGSILEQIQRCAKDANVEHVVDVTTNPNTLAIWPRGGSRGGAVPLISPATGLVGYPSYSSGMGGITVKCVFNPTLRYASRVKVESSLKVANREWVIFNLSHELDSEMPGGHWFTRFDGFAYAI